MFNFNPYGDPNFFLYQFMQQKAKDNEMTPKESLEYFKSMKEFLDSLQPKKEEKKDDKKPDVWTTRDYAVFYAFVGGIIIVFLTEIITQQLVTLVELLHK